MKVFYSWQLDLPAINNKSFIRQCLDSAIAKLNTEIDIAEADRDGGAAKSKVELDHDTKDVLGIPDLAATILRKIDNCDVFLADMTFTGSSSHNDKLYPNSNVLLETGYALGKLGDERIILVMDTAHGVPGKLPFDLVHKRFPVQFNSKADDLKKEKEKLTNQFFEILQAYFRAHSPAPVQSVDIQMKLTYRKEHFQSDGVIGAIHQRQFQINFIATNKSSNTLRGYALEISLPKPIVMTASQTGKRTDEQNAPTAVFHFPISQTNPLPELMPGREQSMAQVHCIVSDRHLDSKETVLAGELKFQMFCDRMTPIARTYSMKDLDPYRLISIPYESRQFDTPYELKPINQS